ncbi:hypothetical protein D9613_005443 [Agrocybe pediades]|uniref:Alpha/beta-hydrolase n=1 Tax=Agrocybe pediades TaxID=84607 RepID=A0A8H4R155_9AGAR|nr:hypothetical protein D9613_005443 [Agrocybe pediades]
MVEANISEHRSFTPRQRPYTSTTYIPPKSRCTMPFVDFHSGTDYASIHYTTNTQHHNVGGFDRNKPTLVILHPMFLDINWVNAQLGDSRLDKTYNIIAFDSRSSGKSICRPNARHDSWVDAADLGICFQLLHLPPSHLLCLESNSICCGLRFAVMFPEMCLSLTLVNVPQSQESPTTRQELLDLMYKACFAQSIMSFERAASKLIRYLFGNPDTFDSELVNDVLAYWKKSMPPSKRIRIAETANLYVNRTPLTTEACARIKQPVLIVQGGKNDLCTLQCGNDLASRLNKTRSELDLDSDSDSDSNYEKKKPVVVIEVKGGGGMVSTVPGYSSIVNNCLLKFIARLKPCSSNIVPPKMSLEDRMQLALYTMADVTGTRISSSLNPASPMSFSCVSGELLKRQRDMLDAYKRDLDRAFSPSEDDWRRVSMHRAHRSDHDDGEETLVAPSQSDLLLSDDPHVIKTTFYAGPTAVGRKSKSKVI